MCFRHPLLILKSTNSAPENAGPLTAQDHICLIWIVAVSAYLFMVVKKSPDMWSPCVLVHGSTPGRLVYYALRLYTIAKASVQAQARRLQEEGCYHTCTEMSGSRPQCAPAARRREGIGDRAHTVGGAQLPPIPLEAEGPQCWHLAVGA